MAKPTPMIESMNSTMSLATRLLRSFPIVLATILLSGTFCQAEEPRPYESVAIDLQIPQYDANNPEHHLIADPSHWQAINQPKKRFFFVTPGDWRDVGPITLTASGTADQPRWLLYYDPQQPEDTTHPWHMPPDRRAWIDRLLIEGGDHWVVDRLRIDGASIVSGGACRNVLNRLMWHEMDKSASDDCLRIGNPRDFQDNSNFNTVQYCVMASTAPAGGQDGCGIYISNADDNQIVRNEIFDMPGDCVQTGQSQQHARRTIIQDNDFYLTPAMYTDGRGNFTRSGPFAAAENAIDIKAHWQPTDALPSDLEDYMLIERNRMWGFRLTDKKAGGTGSGGVTLVIHYRTSSGIIVRGNLLFDGVTGYNCSYKSSRGPNQPRFHEVYQNIFWQLQDRSDQRGTGTALSISEGWDSRYFRNVIIDCKNYLTMNTPLQPQKKRPYARRLEIFQNAFLDSGAPSNDTFHDSVNIRANWYANSPVLPADSAPNPQSFSPPLWSDKPIRVEIKRITDPTTIEIPYGK